MNVVGNGVVLEPQTLFDEIDALAARGVAVTPGNLRVSYKAHVVMPWHKAEDAAREAAAGAAGIGTTQRGIGPCYADKMHRSTAVRVADLVGDPEALRDRIGRIGADKNKVFAALYAAPAVDVADIAERFVALGRRLKPFVDDAGHLVIEAVRAGKRGRLRGGPRGVAGRRPRHLPVRDEQQLLGPGPVHRGRRAADGRAELRRHHQGLQHPRRRRAVPDRADRRDRRPAFASGATSTAPPPAAPAASAGSTPPPSATPSNCAGPPPCASPCSTSSAAWTRSASAPATRWTASRWRRSAPICRRWARFEPVYETLSGWPEEIGSCRAYAELPPAARAYVERLEQLCGAPVAMVSVGPERSATLMR